MDSNHNYHKLCGMCNLKILRRLRLPKKTGNTHIGTALVQSEAALWQATPLQNSAKWRYQFGSQRTIIEAEEIAEILGGRKVLGKRPRTVTIWHNLSVRACRQGPFRRLPDRLHLGNVFCHGNSAFRSEADPQVELRITADSRRIGSYRPHGTSICECQEDFRLSIQCLFGSVPGG
jgi:hypothetical protein